MKVPKEVATDGEVLLPGYVAKAVGEVTGRTYFMLSSEVRDVSVELWRDRNGKTFYATYSGRPIPLPTAPYVNVEFCKLDPEFLSYLEDNFHAIFSC